MFQVGVPKVTMVIASCASREPWSHRAPMTRAYLLWPNQLMCLVAQLGGVIGACARDSGLLSLFGPKWVALRLSPLQHATAACQPNGIGLCCCGKWFCLHPRHTDTQSPPPSRHRIF